MQRVFFIGCAVPTLKDRAKNMGNMIEEPVEVDGTDGDHKERYFNGAWAPPFLFYWVAEGRLDVHEAWIWMNIQTYQKHGRKCYLSNLSIGEGCGMKARAAQMRIQHLLELGILTRSWVIRKGRQGRDYKARILRVCVPNEPEETTPPRTVVLGGPAHGGARGGSTTVLHNEYSNEKQTVSQPAANAAGRGTPLFGGDSKKVGEKPDKAELPSWSLRAAQWLIDAITQVKKVNRTSKLKDWARHYILKLHTVDGFDPGRIKKAMKWYCAQYPKRYGEKYFLVIESGDAFRRKFDQLERAMKESANSDKEARERDGDSVPVWNPATHIDIVYGPNYDEKKGPTPENLAYAKVHGHTVGIHVKSAHDLHMVDEDTGEEIF